MSILWTTAFITGLVGSLHCVGMCGPIALALPVGGMSNWKILVSRAFYNLGRIITYSIIGFIMGFFGEEFFFSGLQQEVSIGIGIFLIAALIISQKHLTIKPLQWINNKVKVAFSVFFKQKSLFSMLFLGLVNGLLPCGFLYLAAAGSVVSGSPTDGMIYMALFGLGTSPAMFAVAFIAKFINLRQRKLINKYSPTFSIILAIFFIIRGLNLGIPYVSPKFEKHTLTKREITVCHGKKTDE